MIDIGGKVNMFNGNGTPALQVDGLPDSLGLSVALLSLQFKGLRRVIHPHDQFMGLS